MSATRDPDLLEAIRTLIYHLPAGATVRAERDAEASTARVVVTDGDQSTTYAAEREA